MRTSVTEIPTGELAAARSSYPNRWFCMSCVAALVRADDIAECEQHLSECRSSTTKDR